MRQWRSAALAGALAAALPAGAWGQGSTAASSPAAPAGGAAPASGDGKSADPRAIPDPAAVTIPDLAFAETPEIAATYDKYYYFHRPDTGFAEALADIRECDGFARGLSSGMTSADVPYPYAGTMAGALGGAIGNAFAAAVFGSAEKRKLRRVNMRRCMHYKGYERYGLDKDIWQRFNFEEGLSRVGEDERQAKLAQQAKVASGPSPQQKGLGL